MESTRVIKSYVWYEDKCFFVSTIERDSSSALGPDRFNETLVWAYDWDRHDRSELLHQDGAMKGSIAQHLMICTRIHDTGKMPGEGDEK